jgi:ribosomal protein S18 acetylase RimI-like enzyme
MITIRRGLANDGVTIARFNVAMALETESIELDPETVAAGVQRVLTTENLGFYLVAETDGKVVGSLMITYEWSDWRNGLFWWIQSVYVEPEYRRKGAFSQLYAAISQQAGHDGAIGLRLYVEHENVRAQGTYRSLGMSETHYRLFERLFEPVF